MYKYHIYKLQQSLCVVRALVPVIALLLGAPVEKKPRDC